ncbi:MAG TPA: c-type cytochrome [Burkholderiales bacterium]|nr:c-type cytochrome [Burkholderiales bacterium]
MSEHDTHSSFIKTPKQLIVVVLLAFVVPVILILMLVQLATSGPSAEPNVLNPDAVAARIQPVGRWDPGAAPPPVAQAPAQAAGKPAAMDAKAVYSQTCAACHQVSVAGSPPLGDKAAWAPRIQQGMDVLVQSVLKGKGAMPPKGGNAALTDAQVRAAVEFMVSQSK